MVTTLTCSLRPTSEQAEHLLKTMRAFNAACEFASEVAWQERCFRNYSLRKLTYYPIRERFGLSSQLAQQAIKKVADAYKLDRKVRRHFHSLGAVTYDCRVFRLVGVSAVSMTLLDGREKIALSTGGYHADRLRGAQVGEVDLVYQKEKRRFRLHLSLKRPDPPEIPTEGTLGVDLGIVNIATTSDGERFAGGHLNGLRHRHRRLRKRLQAKGTRSARRLLVKRRRRESRFARHVNHVISKRIVAAAQGTRRAVALEDLQGIRQRVTARRPQRATLHSWAFNQLGQFIAYKARAAGIPVAFVDPRNTSRTCPACGHVDRANRPSQARFSCVQCGFSGLADHCAAVEIGRRGDVTHPHVRVAA
jgi:putative transposase